MPYVCKHVFSRGEPVDASRPLPPDDILVCFDCVPVVNASPDFATAFERCGGFCWVSDERARRLGIPLAPGPKSSNIRIYTQDGRVVN